MGSQLPYVIYYIFIKFHTVGSKLPYVIYFLLILIPHIGNGTTIIYLLFILIAHVGKWVTLPYILFITYSFWQPNDNFMLFVCVSFWLHACGNRLCYNHWSVIYFGNTYGGGSETNFGGWVIFEIYWFIGMLFILLTHMLRENYFILFISYSFLFIQVLGSVTLCYLFVIHFDFIFERCYLVLVFGHSLWYICNK